MQLSRRKGQAALENVIAFMVVGTACFFLLKQMAQGDDSLLGQVWGAVKGSIGEVIGFAISTFS